MRNFHYKGRQLTCQGIDLAALAKDYGTPLWIYDGDRIKGNYCRIEREFAPTGAKIRYAVKANDSLRVLDLLRSLGSGFDVVSGGELNRVLHIGADPAKIVFAGAAKTDEEIEVAIRAQIGCINVESFDELTAIVHTAERLGIRPNVALRIAPGIDPHTAEKISTSHIGTKFGIEPDVADAILETYDRGGLKSVEIIGLQCHVGSQIHDPEVYALALDVVLPFFARYSWLNTLDLGGGLPVAYGAPKEKKVLPFSCFAQAIGEKLQKANISDLKFLIEPGRAVVADAGILMIQVQSVKSSGRRRIVTCDGGMADLVRPAMYDSWHQILPVEKGARLSLADVAGPHCESSDFLGKDRRLPQLERGDFLTIKHAGAYGRSMSSRYNGSRLAAEIMILDGKIKYCRRREEYEGSYTNELW